MKLLSADDEFVLNTLQEVPGCLGKLEYLNGLREEDGQLKHWGLEKIHGISKARATLEKAYLSALQKLLATPMRELWSECLQNCEKTGENANVRVRTIHICITDHIPSKIGPAQRAHIMLVLDVLCLLAQKEQN